MQLAMHTIEIKGAFVSFHRNTLKEIAETHTSYKRCINRLFFPPLAYCWGPCRHGNLHLPKQTCTHTDRHLTQTHTYKMGALWLTVDPTRIFVYMSPQDQKYIINSQPCVSGTIYTPAASSSNHQTCHDIRIGPAFCATEQWAYFTN